MIDPNSFTDLVDIYMSGNDVIWYDEDGEQHTDILDEEEEDE